MRRSDRRRIILFDDGRARLTPLTDLRPAWDVRTGALTVRERVEAAIGPVSAFLAEKQGISGTGNPGEGALLVSARAALLPPEMASLAEGEALVEPVTGDVVAASAPAGGVEAWLGALPGTPEGAVVKTASRACLLQRPWDVIRHRDAALASDLARIVRDNDRPESGAPEGVAHFGEHPLVVDYTAVICTGVTLDSTNGPIVVGEHAMVRPGAILVGPAFIGPRSVVLERSLIKANTAIGPVCKVAGEVGGTIFQGYANKAHEGHLGDSWVGEWVNLGAGTTNSNLLNTYGEVVARTAATASRERTGLTFLGAIIGDHVKTAICTRLMTGSVLGTGAMIASTAAPSTCVDAFAWVTDAGEQTFRLDKFLDTARRVMSRRDRVLQEDEERALRELHARATAAARA